MYQPPLQMPSFTEQVIIGAVEIDPTVAIAPGVILQSDPECKILLGAGVTIGLGVIIHARSGDLEIGAGSSLGAGVLIIGKGIVGVNCCVGACSTLVSPSLEAGQVIAPGSLLITAPEPSIPEPSTKVAVVHAKAHLQRFSTTIQLGSSSNPT